MERRAEVTMVETRAGEGLGLGATTQAPEAPLSFGEKSGKVWRKILFLYTTTAEA